MKTTDDRKLFDTPIGASAASGNIATIPQTQVKAGDGTASIALGFPPETFIARAAGGEPPRGQDMNGFLNRLSAAVQILQAGYLGPFDETFAQGIGGYPAGAIVSGSSPGTFWVSTADANVSTPGADGAKWQSLFNGYATQAWTENQFVKSTVGGGDKGNIQQLTYNTGVGQLSAQTRDGIWHFAQPAGDYATNPALQAETQRATTIESNLQSSKANLNGGNSYTGNQSVNNAQVIVHNAPTLTSGSWNYSPALIARTDSRAGLQLFAQDKVDGGAAVVLTYEWNTVQQVYWWFGSDGSINNSVKGEVAFQSDLPLPVGMHCQIFTVAIPNPVPADGWLVNIPTGWSIHSYVTGCDTGANVYAVSARVENSTQARIWAKFPTNGAMAASGIATISSFGYF